jgi:hypothetical protein
LPSVEDLTDPSAFLARDDELDLAGLTDGIEGTDGTDERARGTDGDEDGGRGENASRDR